MGFTMLEMTTILAILVRDIHLSLAEASPLASCKDSIPINPRDGFVRGVRGAPAPRPKELQSGARRAAVS
jgi:hypothetical protein